MKSRFYRPAQAALFGACFDSGLQAAEQAFKQAGLSLRQAMQGPCAPALAGFLLKRMEQRMRLRAGFPYAIAADPARMLGHALQGRKRLRAFLASGALAAAIDEAVDGFAKENDLSVLAGSKKPGPAKTTSPPLPAPPPAPPPEVKIDFALLPKIRAQADEMTEMLIVEEEPVGMADKPPAQKGHSGGKNAAPTGLYGALSPAQSAIVEYLCTGKGVPPAMDEIAIEAINEVALEVFGDTLIEADEEGFMVIEEYRESWRSL
jgi:hypothetical protein